jgi:hypothetical protein|tara:strand:+ start:598 stop:765 length:168 start_codon:yes stop_codon:yes gene_type:complete
LILVAKTEIGPIKPGMRFALLAEREDHIEVYCVELDLNFKLNKEIISKNFEIRYR